MKKPTIYQIKEAVQEKCPFFFDRGSMRFFGQTMKSFKVIKKGERIFILANSVSQDGQRKGKIIREFTGDDLKLVDDKEIENEAF